MKQSLTNETTLKINDWFFRHGIYSWRQNTGGMWDPGKRQFRASNKVGVSDIIAILPPVGRFLGVEVKTGKDKLRPEQEGFGKNVEKMGAKYIVVKDYFDFLQKIQKIYLSIFDTKA